MKARPRRATTCAALKSPWEVNNACWIQSNSSRSMRSLFRS